MRFRRWIMLVVAAAFAAAPAWSGPLEFLPVDDPLVEELRVLDLYAPRADRGPIRLPHLNSGPWQVQELLPVEGDSTESQLGKVAEHPHQHSDVLLDLLDRTSIGPRDIAARRIIRLLGRDVSSSSLFTPRLFQRVWPLDHVRAEISLGAEGEYDVTRESGMNSHRFEDGSGLHAELGLQVENWFVFSHLFFGELRGVRTFSDALVANTDIAAGTDESYVSYSGRLWSMQLGHDRWSWGPGESGSLLLSSTSAPMNGLMLALHARPLHADAFFFNATVDPGSGEQLAAHRLEWQPRDAVRLGVAEAARYHAGGWQGVYLAGAIPYSLAQRLLDREHADSSGALRNNVAVAADASVRVADGSRIYGEVLIDDLHARTATVPNKYGGQLGWSGAGTIDRTRLTWNAEYTWLSRYVYTSYFGRAFTAQGEPVGFPTGPGSRRFRTRLTVDPSLDWQLGAIATRIEHGDEGLADAFVPGGPVPSPSTLADPVERTRSLEGFVRWWPAGGIDLRLTVARDWITNAANVSGATTRAWRGAFEFQLTR
jgi:hypothetical protein